jgi:hypothetical protein
MAADCFGRKRNSRHWYTRRNDLGIKVQITQSRLNSFNSG